MNQRSITINQEEAAKIVRGLRALQTADGQAYEDLQADALLKDLIVFVLGKEDKNDREV